MLPEGGDDTRTLITNEYTFLDDANAYIHVNVNQTTAVNNAAVNDVLEIQISTNSGWMTICSEPLRTAISRFDIDVHGFFYAGTKVRCIGRQYGTTTSLSNATPVASGVMVITEVSKEKPFNHKSFTWRASLPANKAFPDSKSSVNQKNIDENGLVRIDGKFVNSTASVLTGGLEAGNGWQTPAVYAVLSTNCGEVGTKTIANQ